MKRGATHFDDSWIGGTQNRHCHQNRLLYPQVKQPNQMTTTFDPCTYALMTDMRMLKEMIASDLAQYIDEMQPDLNDCVDWVCDRFALDATDELIDYVALCHDEFAAK